MPDLQYFANERSAIDFRQAKLYDKMNEAEKREFLEQLISKVEIFEERQANGQWLKSIEFKLPIIEHDMKLSLDNGDSVETVCLLERKGR